MAHREGHDGAIERCQEQREHDGPNDEQGTATTFVTSRSTLDPQALDRFRAAQEAEAPGTAAAVIETAREALAGTLTDLFLISAVVMAVALVMAAFLPRVRARTRAEIMQEAASGSGEAAVASPNAPVQGEAGSGSFGPES